MSTSHLPSNADRGGETVEQGNTQEGALLLHAYLEKYGESLRRYAQDTSLEVQVIARVLGRK